MASGSNTLQHRRSEQDSAPPPVSWSQFLVRDFQSEPSDGDLRVDCVWSVVLLLVWIAVFVVITVVLINNWQAEAKVYTSNNPIPLPGYTCGCSLPLNLQEPEKSSTDVKSTVNLNQCYQLSLLETVTILQYPTNGTGLHDIVREYVSDAEKIYLVNSPGYVVSEGAHELSIGVDGPLKTLYRNEEIGFADEDILFPLQGYILDADFMTFPLSYVRMAFSYICKNCSTCGLDVIGGHIRNVTRSSKESWGSCYYWRLLDIEQCNVSAKSWNYSGKCVLYPTKTLPFSFAIKTFIMDVYRTEGIEDIRSVSSGKLHKFASVQSNVVYLNQTRVTEGLLQYGFVESPRGSALWAWILTHFPSFDTACKDVPDVRDSVSVCNGSSVCNAFVNADDSRSIQLKCRHWKDDTDCENTVKDAVLTLDNRYGKPEGVGTDAICYNPRHSCLSSSEGSKVPAYKVARFASDDSSEPINSYLNSSTLWNDWRRNSGVCTNTYEQVYRYNKTMFLQAECKNGADLCTLTGRYYLVDDFFDQERKLDDRDFYNETGKEDLFVCYQIRDQPLRLWFLNYVNVLFSWLGVLLFLYFSGVYKLYRFLRAKYAHRQNWPRWLKWFADAFQRIACCMSWVQSYVPCNPRGRGERTVRRRQSTRLSSTDVPQDPEREQHSPSGPSASVELSHIGDDPMGSKST